MVDSLALLDFGFWHIWQLHMGMDAAYQADKIAVGVVGVGGIGRYPKVQKAERAFVWKKNHVQFQQA